MLMKTNERLRLNLMRRSGKRAAAPPGAWDGQVCRVAMCWCWTPSRVFRVAEQFILGNKMKTKFVVAGLAWLAIGAASANDITIDAGVLPVSPLAPYGHLFVHDTSAFTDTIDFIAPTSALGSAANPINVKLGTLDVFNITGLKYSVWGGTSTASTIWYGDYLGNNVTNDIALSGPGAYHLLVTGVSDGSSGGAYGVALVSSVPEPEALAMMLAGLGILGVVIRRKKASGTQV